ncbi:pyridine nucleotide-disulfide oxidoreductase domain-containing protein 2-like [Artemia franciscana]|uniref:Pyridine nucleotide-disulfide oxidoreductase domain-containing protein 2 n=1 Tax=Artemia franciscana TaxID=6661 RepID=A0AA88LGZ6_ARTSF|nr:hypothetical protein QYM36_002238 [Artemia franciscana]
MRLNSILFTKPKLTKSVKELKTNYNAIVIGSGHNGLVAAAYLQKKGLNVCVLEKRHVIGGAAVTEEIIPGFKFSRASYLLSLLRPQIIRDLKLEDYGLRLYPRNPSSYTPLKEEFWKGQAKSLTLSSDPCFNKKEIAKFSLRDSEAFEKYEDWLFKFIQAIEPLLDNAPPNLNERSILKLYKSVKPVVKFANLVGRNVADFYDLMSAPAAKVLNTWFESDVLKATLATDSVIGAMMSPETPGSAYVLLHHMMGGINGQKGAWAYVEGGMGSVSQSIANVAISNGADISVNAGVKSIIIDKGVVQGVELHNGQCIKSSLVLSNATPKVTYLDLVSPNHLEEGFATLMKNVDYTSATTKINVALESLPNFLADPSESPSPMPHHQCTIHLNCEKMSMINDAYVDGEAGRISRKPMIEMVLPSSLDPTLAPPGKHVALFFTQYTPYGLVDGEEWTEEKKQNYAKLIFDTAEEYAPGFKQSIIGYEILTPVDLESIFGLTGGNIFHGSMRLDQLYFARPTKFSGFPFCPLKGLFLCGSGAHPGGGVMGAPGKIAADAAIEFFRKH